MDILFSNINSPKKGLWEDFDGSILITVSLFKQGVTFLVNRQNTIEVKFIVFVAAMIARKFFGNFHSPVCCLQQRYLV